VVLAQDDGLVALAQDDGLVVLAQDDGLVVLAPERAACPWVMTGLWCSLRSVQPALGLWTGLWRSLRMTGLWRLLSSAQPALGV
jgi:hypothetical protein